MYAKTLAPPDHPDVIDKVVFIAQMCSRFGMSSMFLIDLIFESLKVKGCPYVKLEEYVRMICVFLTTDITIKINYVFRCYDSHRDGHLDYLTIHTLLTSSVITSSDDHDNEDHVRELFDLVLAMSDKNNDGAISLEEFSDLVHRDILCIELLGSVLPLPKPLNSFLVLIKGKPQHAVSFYFANERENCLQAPHLPPHEDGLYPVRLELP
ncbi:EF-hand calcium-binding domain-containing protein 1 [Elysia marginata]|uniref:EF-hand calcium-binding domain-containing protein 1 n=1 Tax=Elysia marginata TaxID=1093978 RepID=A0AAV4IHU7_9GAST|nr:EF-hand calcium-binding domain-containing protein 1 [Elysia marginata]